MGRYILPELSPSVSLPSNIQIITPTKAIARHTRQLVPSTCQSYYSLESLAQNIVRRQGWGIASTLLSRRLLQNAIAKVIKTQDTEGTAKAYLSTIKDLFRSGINLAQLQQNCDLKMQQLANMAIAYQKLLRQRNKLDSAELYWQGAAKVVYQKTYFMAILSQIKLNWL